VTIRPSVDSDSAGIDRVLLSAFGDPEGPEIVALVAGLLGDATARPALSLVAEIDETIVGHVLFTRARLLPDHDHLKVQILAPLAVAEELQGRGIGGALVREGLRQLAESGVDLVFVLGHPEYYPRFGFRPAGALGMDAPYPIPERHADAWMVQALRPGLLGQVRGTVRCADTLNDPRHWRE
jgi:putative acetyltransferase